MTLETESTTQDSYSTVLADGLIRILKEIETIFAVNTESRRAVYNECFSTEAFFAGQPKSEIEPYSPSMDGDLLYYLKRHAVLYFEMTLWPAIGVSLTNPFLSPMRGMMQTTRRILKEHLHVEEVEEHSPDVVRFKLVPMSDYYSAGYVLGYIAQYGDRPRHWPFARVMQLAVSFLLTDDPVELIVQLKQGLPISARSLKATYEDTFNEPYPWEMVAEDAIRNFMPCMQDGDFYHFDGSEKVASTARERLEHLYLIASDRCELKANYEIVPRIEDR